MNELSPRFGAIFFELCESLPRQGPGNRACAAKALAMGRVPDVLAAIERSGFALIGRFTLPDEAWWEDFYMPMEIRIEELRGKYENDDEALAVLDQLAQEPEMHRRYSDYCAYEFFVARRMG